MSALVEEITVRINDEQRRFSAPITLLGALREVGLGDRRGIAVALDGVVVPRTDWPLLSLRDEQRLIVIQATQGG